MTDVLDATEAPAAEARETAPPRVRSAIGVIVTRFPQIDETSILREINELEERSRSISLGCFRASASSMCTPSGRRTPPRWRSSSARSAT